ncbi:hypothetical protein D9615_001529 [Tricholomella constricta]|uniref:UDP-galactose transporter n=1 Tax=Tricholomella constricta TaxID=117010 RepID=A0A8H5HPE1_9AGAR|nr:hypothetical protein D9615_001529 [Tricholomella constricta]
MAHPRSVPRHPTVNLTVSSPPSPEIHHRSLPTVRSSSSLAVSAPPSHHSSPRLSPLLPSATFAFSDKGQLASPVSSSADGPRICGMPLKYVSLVTLAVQNAALSIVMHYSRVSTPPALSYSPASAVLLNELLKGSISFLIALSRVREVVETPWHRKSLWGIVCALPYPGTKPFWSLCGEIFSPDCWKLSIPALLYVVQNSLQFVAISNLPVASFQVTYQMKILTTAAFSVALLRKRLSSTKWLSLFFLAIGVGIVQIQTSGGSGHTGPKHTTVGSAHDFHVHVMNPMKGFGAVTAACFTSGLAGVYFEMVLKNSRADLWVRNVQLSLFSLIPALLPILYGQKPANSQGFLLDLFRNFGGWAWATVGIQVFGGLVTAIVIKYSDNILKGFATSLSIVLSFLASVFLFDFRITLSFIIGASTVLSATWMYNQPAGKEPIITLTRQTEKLASPFPGNPVESSEPILGQFSRKKSTTNFGIASALGMKAIDVNGGPADFTDTLDTSRYNQAPYGSPYASRTPSRVPSRAPTPLPPSPLHSDGRSSPL